jgi:RNA polymerase sigma-70 factor, ECF subfamily
MLPDLLTYAFKTSDLGFTIRGDGVAMPTQTGALHRAVQGDKDALAALLKQYGPAARKAIAGRIPARWRSVLSEDDVLQQTYADAVRAIRQFTSTEERAFGAFLAQTAKRNLLDALKKLRAEKRGGDRPRVEPRSLEESYASLSQMISAGTSTPSRVLRRKERGLAVQDAIKKLPKDYARVVELYDVQELRLDEVAAALQRSPGAVCMLRARAHERLAKLMGTASRYLSSRS